MIHKHHIIPKHMGGTDDPTNLVELTVAEHAEAHRILYEQYGHWQDKVAWQGLLGLIDHEDILLEMYKVRRGKGNTFYGKKHTEEAKRKMSESKKGKYCQPKNHGNKLKEIWAQTGHPRQGKEPWNKGKKGLQSKSLETKRKISKAVVYNGIEYYSIKEAARVNQTSEYYILKHVTGHQSLGRNCKHTPK
jgi:hypothetical protein